MSEVIKLCCGGKGCPTIQLKGDLICITDDKGISITMTVEESKFIPDALTRLEAINEIRESF